VGARCYTQDEKSGNMLFITSLVSQPHQPFPSRFFKSDIDAWQFLDIEHPLPIPLPTQAGKGPNRTPRMEVAESQRPTSLSSVLRTSRKVSHRDGIGAEEPKRERVRYSGCKVRDSRITVAQPPTKRKPQHDKYGLLPALTQAGSRSAHAGTEISG
jgi:hypothetical protein